MADEPVLHGLLRKRATMAGEIEALRAQLGELLTGLDHIDSTIRIFKPDIGLDDLPERAPPPPNAAFRGEVQRFLLDVLRAATEPLAVFNPIPSSFGGGTRNIPIVKIIEDPHGLDSRASPPVQMADVTREIRNRSYH